MTAIRDYLKRVFSGTGEEFFSLAQSAMQGEKKLFVVTANPEILMNAQRNPQVEELLLSEETVIVPDGISVVKAMRRCGLESRERITGVDLAQRLLKAAGEAGKRICLLGAKEEVVSTLAQKLQKQYPQAQIYAKNGYGADKDEDFGSLSAHEPDLFLVALGAPNQELLIFRHLKELQKGVLIGVGGSFDVLSGLKRRAPKIFVKTNTEWLYRILREPSRLERFYRNNVKFLREVKRVPKETRKEK